MSFESLWKSKIFIWVRRVLTSQSLSFILYIYANRVIPKHGGFLSHRATPGTIIHVRLGSSHIPNHPLGQAAHSGRSIGIWFKMGAVQNCVSKPVDIGLHIGLGRFWGQELDCLWWKIRFSKGAWCGGLPYHLGNLHGKNNGRSLEKKTGNRCDLRWSAKWKYMAWRKVGKYPSGFAKSIYAEF